MSAAIVNKAVGRKQQSDSRVTEQVACPSARECHLSGSGQSEREGAGGTVYAVAARESHMVGDWNVSFVLGGDGRPCGKVAVTSTSRWRGLTLDAASRLEPDMWLEPPEGLDTPDKRHDWAAVRLARLRAPS